MLKKIISVMMVALVVFTMLSIPVSAASSKRVYVAPNRTWSASVRCTLGKNWLGQRKDGKVRVSIQSWGVNVDVRMRNGGRTIWSQNNAIVSNNARSANVYRDFNLGKNYAYYDLSFRSNKKYAVGVSATVSNRSNVSIS